MTRIAPLLLALALTLGACDSAAPSSAADATAAPAPMANAKSDAVHRITEAVSVFVEGDRVLLEVEGDDEGDMSICERAVFAAERWPLSSLSHWSAWRQWILENDVSST